MNTFFISLATVIGCLLIWHFIIQPVNDFMDRDDWDDEFREDLEANALPMEYAARLTIAGRTLLMQPQWSDELALGTAKQFLLLLIADLEREDTKESYHHAAQAKRQYDDADSIIPKLMNDLRNVNSKELNIKN